MYKNDGHLPVFNKCKNVFVKKGDQDYNIKAILNDQLSLALLCLHPRC